jgi:hypothetical protein
MISVMRIILIYWLKGRNCRMSLLEMSVVYPTQYHCGSPCSVTLASVPINNMYHQGDPDLVGMLGLGAYKLRPQGCTQWWLCWQQGLTHQVPASLINKNQHLLWWCCPTGQHRSLPFICHM